MTVRHTRLLAAGACLTGVLLATGCNDNTPATTSTRVDRMAIPAINTALIPTDAQKDQFNQGQPSTDAAMWQNVAATRIGDLRAAVLPYLGTPDADSLGASTLAGLLIPDQVTIDFSKPVLFTNHSVPNGRRLQDDVIDAELGLVLNRGDWLGGGPGVSDAINANDVAIPAASFPWEAAPHMALTP